MGKTLKREVISDGRVFSFGREAVLLPSGVTTQLDIIKHPGLLQFHSHTAKVRWLLLGNIATPQVVICGDTCRLPRAGGGTFGLCTPRGPRGSRC